MNTQIRLAGINELDLIYDFYKTVCKSLENEKYTPLWQIDSHPCADDIENHINNNEMYIAVCDGKVAGAMAVVNHNKCSSLHLLAVHADYRKQHLAEALMNKMFEIAKERKNSKIILDVVKGNLPAERLYKKVGFKFVSERYELIERFGDVCFDTYEYILSSK